MSITKLSNRQKKSSEDCRELSFKIPKILQDSPSHQIFGHMHEALNIGKKKLITQFVCKCRDESFEPS
jgi:hypothetical protein